MPDDETHWKYLRHKRHAKCCHVTPPFPPKSARSDARCCQCFLLMMGQVKLVYGGVVHACMSHHPSKTPHSLTNSLLVNPHYHFLCILVLPIPFFIRRLCSSATQVELCKEFGRDGGNILSLSFAVETTETSAVADQHVGAGR